MAKIGKTQYTRMERTLRIKHYEDVLEMMNGMLEDASAIAKLNALKIKLENEIRRLKAL